MRIIGEETAMAFAVATFAVATVGMAASLEPFATWYFSCAWWSYIVFLIFYLARRDRPSLAGAERITVRLLALSIVIWVFFEYYNFRLENWYYLELPRSRWVRWTGYTVAYATVLPGLFLTTRLIEPWLRPRAEKRGPSLAAWPRWLLLLGVVGSIAPLLAPRYFFPMVWIGPTAGFAAINYWRGEGILRDIEKDGPVKLYRLLIAGAICGLLWELWNFWARSKWAYQIPFFDRFHLFEMPLAGFLGFPPFAVECHEMYVAARALDNRLSRRRWRRPLLWLFVGGVVLGGYLGIDAFTVRSFQD